MACILFLAFPICVLSFLLGIIGLIDPGLVVRWGEKRDIGQAVKIYGSIFAASFAIAFAAFMVLPRDTLSHTSSSPDISMAVISPTTATTATAIMATHEATPAVTITKTIERTANPSPATKNEPLSDSDLAKIPIEYQLAIIDANGYIPDDDVSVARFRYLLGEIEKKTVNKKSDIADMTVKARSILKEKYGKEVKIIEIMENANKAMPRGKSKCKYNEIMALLVVYAGQ